MSTKQLLTTVLLGALAEITLLGVFVFIDEPTALGHSGPSSHPWELVYLGLPVALVGAAAFLPVRAFLRWRRAQRAS